MKYNDLLGMRMFNFSEGLFNHKIDANEPTGVKKIEADDEDYFDWNVEWIKAVKEGD